MAEPIGLTMSAVTTFKEVFLLSRAIYRIIKSTKHAANERRDLHVEFYHEVLFLRDFGRRFFQDPSYASFDKHWLEVMQYDFLKLHRAFSDYHALAAKEDNFYQQYSPLLNDARANTLQIEFPLDLEPPDGNYTQLEDVRPRVTSWLSNTSSGLRWLFYTRRKFESVLADFKKWNGKLKEIGQACMLDHIKIATAGWPGDMAQGPEDQTLGLGPLASLKRLTVEPDSDMTDFEIRNSMLERINDFERRALTIENLVSSNDRKEKVLVEHKEYGDLDLEHNISAVHQLASLLSTSGKSDLKTLSFRGFIKPDSDKSDRHVCTFIFDFPEHSLKASPTSLHAALSTGEFKPAVSLVTRFKLAEILARTVWYLHTVGWIHKSIRSSNVIFFESEQGKVDFTSPYLVGFEYARLETDETEFTGFDEDVAKNIYRHPDRQGPPTTRFARSHDLYALGLVLLEIGLWRTLRMILDEDMKRDPENPRKKSISRPKRVMEVFQTVAGEQLAHSMGDAYANAVMDCLSVQADDAKDSATVYAKIVQKVTLDSLE